MQAVTINVVKKAGLVPIMVGAKHSDEPLVLVLSRYDTKMHNFTPELGARGMVFRDEDIRDAASRNLLRETGINIALGNNLKRNFLRRAAHLKRKEDGSATIVKTDWFAQIVSSRNRGNRLTAKARNAMDWMRFGDIQDILVRGGMVDTLRTLDLAKKFWKDWKTKQDAMDEASVLVESFIGAR